MAQENNPILYVAKVQMIPIEGPKPKISPISILTAFPKNSSKRILTILKSGYSTPFSIGDK